MVRRCESSVKSVTYARVCRSTGVIILIDYFSTYRPNSCESEKKEFEIGKEFNPKKFLLL